MLPLSSLTAPHHIVAMYARSKTEDYVRLTAEGSINITDVTWQDGRQTARFTFHGPFVRSLTYSLCDIALIQCIPLANDAYSDKPEASCVALYLRGWLTPNHDDEVATYHAVYRGATELPTVTYTTYREGLPTFHLPAAIPPPL